MKYLAVILLAISVTASAEELKEKTCAIYSNVANRIMTLRQIGEDMATVYAGSDSEHYRKLVIDAYEQPRYGSKPYQDKIIAKFQNKAFLQCIKSQ